MDTDRVLEVVAATATRREAEWSWSILNHSVKARFIAAMADRLPRLDPQKHWQAMPVRYRQELAWHLSRTTEQLRSAWEEDCERLRLKADEATVEAFKALSHIVEGDRSTEGAQ
jgi:hypothetical protein